MRVCAFQLKSRVCICVSPSCALVFCYSHFSGERSALLTQHHSRGLGLLLSTQHAFLPSVYV